MAKPSIEYSEVREFVTRVWEHPLLDNKTRAHRARARTRLSHFMTGAGFLLDEFATIPVGSLLWTTDQESDFDYKIIFETNTVRRGVERAFSLTRPLDNQDIEIHNFLDKETISKQPESFAYLFLTPDEYIGGNTAMVADLRLEGIAYFAQPKNEALWDRVVRRTFDSAFRYWESDKPEHQVYTRKSFKHGYRNRSHRLTTKLQQRAQQTHAPERYFKAFHRAREQTRLPNFSSYQRALTESNGRLTILPNRAALGILPPHRVNGNPRGLNSF